MTKPKNPVDEYRLAYIEQVLGSRGLTHAEARVAARLGHYANRNTLACFPSVALLARKTAHSDERNVRRVLQSLKRKGWITWKENPGGSRRGEGISNDYELLDTHMPPGQKNPVSEARALAAYKAYRATLSPVTGLVGEQPGQNGQGTLSRKADNPVTSSEPPGHQRPPNLSNRPNPDLNLGSGQAGSLATALDGSALASPRTSKPRSDRERATAEMAQLVGWEPLVELSPAKLSALCDGWLDGSTTAATLALELAAMLPQRAAAGQ
jgi:hypothetical protein